MAQPQTVVRRLASLKAVACLLAALSVLSSSACAPDKPVDIVGNWRPSDRSRVKAIMADGTCTGMYYSRGEALDIGGRMTCSFSQGVDEDGNHTMVVSQPPNETTLLLHFRDADTVEVRRSDGLLQFTMTRL